MPVPNGEITSTDIYNQPVEEPVVEETKEEENEGDDEEVSS
jgi:hypothetical protein